MKRFNFDRSVSYVDPAVKIRWHSQARAKLRALANALGLDAGTYDLRSHPGGIAVSGEIILHGEHIYVQVNQPFGGYGNPNSGVLFRRCKGRRDYEGRRNNFAPLDLLNEPEPLAALIERELGPVYKPNANEVVNQS